MEFLLLLSILIPSWAPYDLCLELEWMSECLRTMGKAFTFPTDLSTP